MNRLKRRISRRRIPLGVAVLAAVIAAPLLVALNPLTSTEANGGSRPAAATAPASLTQLKAALPLLDTPATGADVMPTSAQGLLNSIDPKANAALARRAMVTASGTSVYLVPSEEGVCLIDSTLSETGCFPTTVVLSGHATESDECSPGLPNGNTVEIAGVVPNGASNPVVTFTDGTQKPLAVEGNAYLEQFSKAGPLPMQIEWNIGAERVDVSAQVPSDVATESCVTSTKELKALEASGRIPPALGHPPAQTTGRVEYNRG